MISPLTYHRKVKDEQHVFIFCVAGRSSSTAFQRIINSSNMVWIWGERHRIMDATVALINRMKKFWNDKDVKFSLIQMYSSYNNNKHLNFYPNAIGNLDTTIDILNSSVSNILKPWDTKVKRFGFKDIQVDDIETLYYLKETFSQSFIVFCFRDPLKQWPSVQASGWWIYCEQVQTFLDEYYRISSIYLEFALKTGTCVFIENSNLRDRDKINHIIKYLNIPKIDDTLIDVTVNSAEAKSISDEEKEIILKSDAYKNYLEMKNMSASFYKA